eukprot:SAG25_NODE_21_length_22373_cov_13.904373_36_plen_178_part_00
MGAALPDPLRVEVPARASYILRTDRDFPTIPHFCDPIISTRTRISQPTEINLDVFIFARSHALSPPPLTIAGARCVPPCAYPLASQWLSKWRSDWCDMKPGTLHSNRALSESRWGSTPRAFAGERRPRRLNNQPFGLTARWARAAGPDTCPNDNNKQLKQMASMPETHVNLSQSRHL